MGGRTLGMVAALGAIWITLDLATGGVFLSARNLYNLAVQSSAVGVMATGMVLVIVARRIDLSVGSVLGFVGMAIVTLQVEILPVDAAWTWPLSIAVGLALGAALSFSVTIAIAQQASHLYGELQTVVLARWVSLLACALLLLVRRQSPRIPLRWWPWIGLQGLLDGGAYVALLTGSQGPGAEIAVVISSGFGAVTVLLARLVLRETMTWSQWAGIAAIVAGVAVLSGLQ